MGHLSKIYGRNETAPPPLSRRLPNRSISPIKWNACSAEALIKTGLSAFLIQSVSCPQFANPRATRAGTLPGGHHFRRMATLSSINQIDQNATWLLICSKNRD
jgi:hypothetical protein